MLDVLVCLGPHLLEGHGLRGSSTGACCRHGRLASSIARLEDAHATRAYENVSGSAMEHAVGEAWSAHYGLEY